MRVLCFSHSLQRDGAPIALRTLLGELVRRGVVARLAAPHDGPLRAGLEQLGVETTVTGRPFLPADVQHYRALIEADRPDVIHANTVDTAAIVVAGALARVPVVWNVHEMSDRVHQGSGLRRLAHRLLFALPSRTVFVSEASRDFYRFAPRRRSVVIPNAAPAPPPGWEQQAASLRAELGAGRYARILVIVGYLDPIKGQLRFLERFHRFLRDQRILLVLVGGTRRPEYRQAIVDLVERECPDNVVVAGEQDDPWPFYGSADLCLSVSTTESSPLSIHEAIAIGRPVLAPRIGGIPELLAQTNLYASEDELERRLAGYLVDSTSVPVPEPGTTIAELAEAYLRVYRAQRRPPATSAPVARVLAGRLSGQLY